MRTDSGELKKALDPIFKDVYITAEIRVSCQKSVCFYNEVFPVKIGQDWRVQSNNNQIKNAQVIEILVDPEKIPN